MGGTVASRVPAHIHGTVAAALEPGHTAIMLRLPTLSLSLALLCFGCSSSDAREGTLGEQGKVEFSYRQSCFFGCPLLQPLLVGTRERIALSSPGASEGVSVESGDSGVATFALSRTCFCQQGKDTDDRIEIAEDARCGAARDKVCEASVQVSALSAGDAQLTLIDAQGSLLDRATVYVREADSARFSADALGSVESLALRPGERLALTVKLYDAQGQRLLAPEGVRWRTGREEIARVSAWLIGSGSELEAGSSVDVEAESQGDTELSIEVPGLEASLPLEVR